ncbi:TPA: BMP family protein [Streptococcus suis]
MNKKIVGAGLVTVAVLGLAACGNRSGSKGASTAGDTDLKVAMVTDTGGVDDKSFNQSAWEGLKEWGADHNLSQGNGYDYFQSSSASDYSANFSAAVDEGYGLIAGIGFSLADAVTVSAKDYPDTKFVMIDNVIEGLDNVASATFADHEASYLAGIAAAKATKTKKIGFIGGMEGAVITRFEKGFIAGVQSVDESIKVDVQYAGSFTDAAKGKTVAAAQYASGADVIFHAAGATGNGVFSEAKEINEQRAEADKVWVVGVDRDQSDLGEYTDKDGKDSNFVLVSTIKKVGQALRLVADQTAEGNFPGGKINEYGLKDGGVDIALTNTDEETVKLIEEAKEKIISGEIVVPEK